jgi:hypothetical protein
MPIRARKSESKREFAQVYKRSATALKVNMFFRARRLGLRDVYNRMPFGGVNPLIVLKAFGSIGSFSEH